tara:strand:- start:628 stop:1371 length:744 start_codon:yes stop_codon:yes gene_type:complete
MRKYNQQEEIQRDLFRRKKLMKKKFSLRVLRNLASQYNMDINDTSFVNLIMPPGEKDYEGDIDYTNEDIRDDDNPQKLQMKNRAIQGSLIDRSNIKYNRDGSSSTGRIEFDSIKAGQYRELLKLNNAERDMEHPVLNQIEPTDEERATGFMFRYFLQQANSPTAPIIEVDKEQYEDWLKIGGGIDRQFYNGTVLKWRVRGSLENITGTDGIVRKGVLEGNQASINLAAETLPALKTQVRNLVKYWKR